MNSNDIDIKQRSLAFKNSQETYRHAVVHATNLDTIINEFRTSADSKSGWSRTHYLQLAAYYQSIFDAQQRLNGTH
jgi:hypothetical protein